MGLDADTDVDADLTDLVADVADLLLAAVLGDVPGLVALVAPVLLLPALAGEVAVPAKKTVVSTRENSAESKTRQAKANSSSGRSPHVTCYT